MCQLALLAGSQIAFNTSSYTIKRFFPQMYHDDGHGASKYISPLQVDQPKYFKEFFKPWALEA